MPITTYIGLGRPGAASPHRVGEFQFAVLSIIGAHPTDAHAVGVANRIRASTDRTVADSQVHMALKRLEARGFVEPVVSPERSTPNLPSSRPRGRPRKLYRLTKSGRGAINCEGASNSKVEPDDARKELQNGISASDPTAVVG